MGARFSSSPSEPVASRRPCGAWAARRRYRSVRAHGRAGCAQSRGGDRIAVTSGDFADVPVVGSYSLIFVVFNTLFNLLTQEDQIRCFGRGRPPS